MLTTPIVPPPIGGTRFLELGAQPILDHFLQFARNCNGWCLQKDTGPLVELGVIVFGVEILAECSSAPPDTYQRSFKKFQTVSNSLRKFKEVSESKLTRKVMAALLNLAVFTKLFLGPTMKGWAAVTGRFLQGIEQVGCVVG
jgi:hypothetical protein